MGKRLGQHFLRSPETIERIVQACRLGPDDAVVEAGPGEGVLTKPLLARCGRLTAVELDERLCERLRRELGGEPRFTLVQGDFLKVPDSAFPAGPLKFAGNLPYQAGGPILRRMLAWPSWTLIVVMLQKEVAQRLMAEPGTRDYGTLTVETALKASVDWVTDVGPECFDPPPKVDSAVVSLSPRRVELGGCSEEAVMRGVYGAFRQRRKTILNSLSASLGLDKPVLQKALEEAGIAPGARAETVPLEAYVRLARLLP